jgi:hypothetical protein
VENKKRQKAAVVLFLLFSGLFVATMITVNVVQANQTGCGLGIHNQVIAQPAIYRQFYRNVARATGSDGLRTHLPFCGSRTK